VKSRTSTDAAVDTARMKTVEKMKITMCATAILEYDMVFISNAARANSRRMVTMRAEWIKVGLRIYNVYLKLEDNILISYI
jgi:hypothetical protein